MVAQSQLLNLILSSGDLSVISNNDLSVDYFSGYQNEFNFIINHYKQYNQVPDTLTFLNVFPEFDIVEVKESTSYLVNELYRDKERNDLVKMLNSAREDILNKNFEKAKQNLTNAISDINKNKRLEAIDILDDISRYEEYVDKCDDYGKYYISTGFRELDSVLGGWSIKDEYSVIIARAGVGKSFCAMKSIVAAVNQGLKVGLYSGEMTVNKVAYRIDSIMSHISNTKLNRGNSNVSVEYKKYLDELKSNHKGNLFVVTPDMMPGDPTVSMLESFIEKYNLDILFVDQQTLLTDQSKARVAYEKAANISKALKMLQVRKRIPIITVTQQNRTAVEEGKFAGTENVSGSDRIAQDATTIISVNKEDDVMSIHIVKARDGGTGRTFNYIVDLDHGKWDYIPNEDDATLDTINNEVYSPKFEYDTNIGEDVF